MFFCFQISLGNHVSVDEIVTYSPHPENPETTLLTQQAVISIQGVPLIDHLERLLTITMEQNANKVNSLVYILATRRIKSFNWHNAFGSSLCFAIELILTEFNRKFFMKSLHLLERHDSMIFIH